MPISEDIGSHLNNIANNSFNGKAACIDLRIDAFYHHSFSSVHRLRHEQTSLTRNRHKPALAASGQQNLLL
jgi:hypothetical protein